MATQHTPGTWRAEGIESARPEIWADSGRLGGGTRIASLACYPSIDAPYGDDVVEANAWLIAAAPDLLDVLLQYTANDDALEAGLPFGAYTREHNRIYALAKAAIAKARGQAVSL